MTGAGSPVIFLAIYMAKQSLNPGLNFGSSRGAELDSDSCASLPVIFLPPPFYCCSVRGLFPGCSCTTLVFYWNPPGMTMLSGKKCLVAIILIRFSNLGHLIGRDLVKKLWKLLLNLVRMSWTRAASINGWYFAFELRREFTSSDASIDLFQPKMSLSLSLSGM